MGARSGPTAHRRARGFSPGAPFAPRALRRAEGYSLAMRRLLMAFAAAAISAAAFAQAPAKSPAASRPSAPKPTGTLAQIMRGIYFPSSNLVFDVQHNDPSAPRKTGEQAGSA